MEYGIFKKIKYNLFQNLNLANIMDIIISTYIQN